VEANRHARRIVERPMTVALFRFAGGTVPGPISEFSPILLLFS